MRIQEIIKILAIFLFLFVFLAIVIPFSPDKLSDFYYRELTYSVISERHKGDNIEDSIKSLFHSTSVNMTVPEGHKLVDKNPYNDVIRGVAWCDQQDFYVMTLLNKIGIERTRLRDVKGHTILEVLVDGSWIMLDPLGGLMLTDSDGKLINIDSMLDPGVGDIYGVIEATRKYIKDKTYGNNYENIYIPTEKRWLHGISPEFREYRRYTFIRTLFERYSSIVFSVFGVQYYNWVQDIYLSTGNIDKITDQGSEWIANYGNNYNNNSESFKLFYKARNYDIADRESLARFTYTYLINNFNDSYWDLEAKYFLGILEARYGNYIKSEELLTELIDSKPIRKKYLSYHLGVASLKNGNLDKAIKYFTQSEFHYAKVELHKILK